ncbi:hypothetical protein P4V43_22820 [Brevibacillus fortis]|nr:hypothetical protein [Brevibacillus fortis]MED1784668.1 hypothetical protein [Brevibacillus fortis]
MLKKGDKVVMHTCLVASIPTYQGKIWTCDGRVHSGEWKASGVLERVP